MTAQEYVESLQPDIAAGKLKVTGSLAGKTPRPVHSVTVSKNGSGVIVDTGLVDYFLPVAVAQTVLKVS